MVKSWSREPGASYNIGEGYCGYDEECESILGLQVGQEGSRLAKSKLTKQASSLTESYGTTGTSLPSLLPLSALAQQSNSCSYYTNPWSLAVPVPLILLTLPILPIPSTLAIPIYVYNVRVAPKLNECFTSVSNRMMKLNKG